MFWTRFVKIVCKIILVLGIAASLIVGVLFMFNPILGFIIILGGTLVSFLLVSITMMACEASKNIAETNRNLLLLVKHEIGNESGDAPSMSSPVQMNNPTSANGSKSVRWFCPMCGAQNPDTVSVCQNCNYSDSKAAPPSV